MYSYVYQRVAHPESDLKENHRAKGIARSAAKQLKHQQYADQLKVPIENCLYNRRIGSERHKIYTYSVCNSHMFIRGVNASIFIDKRCPYLILFSYVLTDIKKRAVCF